MIRYLRVTHADFDFGKGLLTEPANGPGSRAPFRLRVGRGICLVGIGPQSEVRSCIIKPAGGGLFERLVEGYPIALALGAGEDHVHLHRLEWTSGLLELVVSDDPQDFWRMVSPVLNRRIVTIGDDARNSGSWYVAVPRVGSPLMRYSIRVHQDGANSYDIDVLSLRHTSTAVGDDAGTDDASMKQDNIDSGTLAAASGQTLSGLFDAGDVLAFSTSDSGLSARIDVGSA